MKKSLNLFEATSIIVGAGVGGGVMAVPYLAARPGFPAFLVIIALATGLNIGMNLLLADIAVRDGRDAQVVELMRAYVFRGPWGSGLSWVVFAVLGLSFIASLTAYVHGAGRVLAELVRWPILPTQLGVYGASAAVVFFGLKSVGRSEALALGLLIITCLVIGIGSGPAWAGHQVLISARMGFPQGALALFGVVMYSLNATFAVPQAVKGLGGDKGRITIAVAAGTVVNALVVVLITLVALAVSDPVTDVAVVGISAATGPVVSAAASLFVIAAMMTTYWSVSLALAEIISQRTGWNERPSWLVASLPTVVLLVIRAFGFVQYMQIAGGIVALVVLFAIVPMFLRARKEREIPDPVVRIGRIPTIILLSLLTGGMVLMAVGSFLGALSG